MRFQKLIVIGAVIGVSLFTGACTERAIELWEKPHTAEGEGLGDVTRQNMAQHIVNPEPAKPTANDAAVSSERVGLGTNRYNQGKSIKPKGTDIGGGGSSSN